MFVKIDGVELEFVVNFGGGLCFDFNGSYFDVRYGIFLILDNMVNFNFVFGLQDLFGNWLNYILKWRGKFGLEYEMVIGVGMLKLCGEYMCQLGIFFMFFNCVIESQKVYGIGNLFFMWILFDGKIDFIVYVKNVGNGMYCFSVQIVDLFWGCYVSGYFNELWIFGIMVVYCF